MRCENKHDPGRARS